MATSEAGICNLALSKLGETQFIDSLTADTEAARVCNVLFGTSRDFVLEQAAWPFATRHALLGLLEDHTTTTPTTRKAFAYIYALPTECLVPQFLDDGAQNPPESAKIPFRLEDDATNGPVLLTDVNPAELVYTRKVTEVGKMPASFQEALAWKLAFELTLAIPVKSALGLQMWQGFERALANAGVSAFNHQQRSAPPRPSSVRVR